MSTYYRPTKKIALDQIKALREFTVIYDKKQNKEVFFDGKNYLHFAIDNNHNVIDIFRYGRNDETNILNALKNNFNMRIVSEHDEEYSHFKHEDTVVINLPLTNHRMGNL
jgi:hypothetical protein